MSPGSEMMMQPGAAKMHVQVSSPQPGIVLKGNTLSRQVHATGFQLSCDHAGKPDEKGIGH